MENSINAPLSGEEVQKAILDKIATALANDSRLAAHYAFRGFSFTASLKIELPGAVEEKVERELAATVGETGASPEIVVIDAEMPVMPVDEARIETGQPVTVEAFSPDGKVTERKVKYARSKAKNGKEAAS